MKMLEALWFWLQVSGAVVAATAICWLGAQYAFHLKLLTVQTGSMQPTFSPGDALIMHQTKASDLRPGMIVSYRSLRNPNELVTHRVVSTFPQSRRFQTKGDRLAAPDPAVGDNLLMGRVVAVLPGLGKVLNWLRSWPGLVACVYLPAAAVAIGELYRLEKRRGSTRFYRLYKAQVI